MKNLATQQFKNGKISLMEKSVRKILMVFQSNKKSNVTTPNVSFSIKMFMFVIFTLMGLSFTSKNKNTTYRSNECVTYLQYDAPSNSDVYKVTCNCCVMIYNLDGNGNVTSGMSFSFVPGKLFNVTRTTQKWGYCQ